MKDQPINCAIFCFNLSELENLHDSLDSLMDFYDFNNFHTYIAESYIFIFFLNLLWNFKISMNLLILNLISRSFMIFITIFLESFDFHGFHKSHMEIYDFHDFLNYIMD